MATAENSRNNTTAGTSKRHLPSINQLPEADVVIYDGECNFCRRQVWRLNWFTNRSLAYISLHDPAIADLCPELTHEQLMQRMYVVTRKGKYFGGAEAIKYLSIKLPRLWFLAPLLHIPFTLPIWHFLYDQVAKSRYLIAGKSSECENGSCDVHFKK